MQTRRKLIAGFVFISGILLLIAVIMMERTNLVTKQPGTPTPGSIDQVQRISVEEAKAALEAGLALFLDVRAESSFMQAHIPGAMHMTLADLPSGVSELDPNAWIIPYCT